MTTVRESLERSAGKKETVHQRAKRLERELELERAESTRLAGCVEDMRAQNGRLQVELSQHADMLKVERRAFAVLADKHQKMVKSAFTWLHEGDLQAGLHAVRYVPPKEGP